MPKPHQDNWGARQCAPNENDPHSFSNPDAVRAERIDISWLIDFTRETIRGSLTYHLFKRNEHATHIVFDTQDLSIFYVKDGKDRKLEYTMCEEVSPFGVPMKIKLPPFNKHRRGVIKIGYETRGSTSVQWISSALTSDKTHPFMYNQGQAVNNRSLLPCQDTPSTKAAYFAEVIVPVDFTAVMSGIRVGTPKILNNGTHKRFKFEQNIVIPSYLISIAVGKLSWVDVGPRSRVFAEESLLQAAADEFADTEFILSIAEKLCGEYVWGPYDIVVLPASFPYAAKENPCVTFVSPTLLAGDKSLAYMIAHEVAHSWTGNLVTNKNFEHFWINEGLTMYLERKIIGILSGERLRQLLSINGWKTLKEEVLALGSDSALTALVPDLKNQHPDEAFSDIPYEKGYVFVYYLVEVIGGAGVFGPFFQEYIKTFKYKSVDSNAFKDFFMEYFENKGMGSRIHMINWDTWLYGTGMPPYTPRYDSELASPCLELRDRWMNWDTSSPSQFSQEDLKAFEFPGVQLLEFLALLLDEGTSLPLEKVKAMESAYDMNANKNCEITARWLRLCVRSKWRQQLTLIAKFMAEQGRLSFNKPLYRELYAWEEIRPLAIDLFHGHAPRMMSVAAESIARELNLA